MVAICQDQGRPEERRPEHNKYVQGSLRELIRKNAHTPLFVHPLDWTNEHLRVLDCQFETETVAKATTKNSLEPILEPIFEKELLDNLFCLRMKRGRKMKDIAMRWIVERIARMFLPVDQVTRG